MTIDDRDSLNVQNKIRSIKAVDVIIYRQSVSRSRDGKIPALFGRKMGIIFAEFLIIVHYFQIQTSKFPGNSILNNIMSSTKSAFCMLFTIQTMG